MDTPRQCTFVDEDGTPCSKPHKGRGYCETHLLRLRKYGDPGIVLKRGRKPSTEPPEPCPILVDGKECGKPIDSLGLCRNHYMRQYRRGGDPGETLTRGRKPQAKTEPVQVTIGPKVHV